MFPSGYVLLIVFKYVTCAEVSPMPVGKPYPIVIGISRTSYADFKYKYYNYSRIATSMILG